MKVMYRIRINYVASATRKAHSKWASPETHETREKAEARVAENAKHTRCGTFSYTVVPVELP